MKKVKSEVTIEITHGRAKRGKTEFKGVIGKILVSGLALSILVGSASMPAFATNTGNDYTTLAEVQMNDSLSSLLSTIESVERLKEKGLVSEASLISLAEAIEKLQVTTENMDEVNNLLSRAEVAIQGIEKEAVSRVRRAITNKRVDSYTAEQALAGPTVKSFPDVNQGDWFYDNVMGLVGMGAISGYPDGTFLPNNSISYAEYLTILIKTTHAGSGDYSVSEDEEWYNGVLRAAYETEILKSGDVEDFGKPITRADAAKFTEKAVQRVLGEPEVSTDKISSIVADYHAFKGSSAEYYILQQYGKGIIVGDDKNNFNPNNNLTRAEASTIILRTVKPDLRKDMSNIEIPSVDDSIVITDNKFYNGRMKTEIATQYDLQALETARFYKENGRLFISTDLPELPEGFKWQVSAGAYTADNNDVFYTRNEELEGVTGHQVIEVVSKFSNRTVNDIACADLSVYIMNNERKSMVSHRISTNAVNQVLRQSTVVSADAGWESFNTSSIFNW